MGTVYLTRYVTDLCSMWVGGAVNRDSARCWARIGAVTPFALSLPSFRSCAFWKRMSL